MGLDFDGAAHRVLELYSSLNFRPPPGQFTVLASFVLSSENSLKIISLATGSKCLPAARLPQQGDALHDSHAEILARRAATRWFLEEAARSVAQGGSQWIKKGGDGIYSLRDNVHMHMYVSTPPCGDASTRFLASFQDEKIAALKNSNPFPSLPVNAASRGRNNYSLYGVLRTKPGRADSPATLSMSCSDKIAVWNVVGMQGALASRILKPIYISSIVIGEVDDSMQDLVRQDCERAFYERLQDTSDLPVGYILHKPQVLFTSLTFMHSRTYLTSKQSRATSLSSCNESLCWLADSTISHEVLINGLKRGVSPKHRHNLRFRPQCSKVGRFQLVRETLSILGRPTELDASSTYFECKQSTATADYQAAKRALMGEAGPFSGWIKSGKRWESFNVNGECIESTGL